MCVYVCVYVCVYICVCVCVCVGVCVCVYGEGGGVALNKELAWICLHLNKHYALITTLCRTVGGTTQAS